MMDESRERTGGRREGGDVNIGMIYKSKRR